MTALIDTSALYAVLDADDDQHPAALRAWQQLLDERASLHVTSYVIVETVTLLQHRIGFEGVRTLVADMLPVLETIWIDEGMHRSALHALLVASRRSLSLVDCASFEAMRRFDIEAAFSFDPHFAQQGFRLIPAARA